MDIIYRRFCKMLLKIKTQEKNNEMKVIVLNSLDDKRSQICKNIDISVKAWKLESTTTLNKLCSVCKKCSIFSNLDTGKYNV